MPPSGSALHALCLLPLLAIADPPGPPPGRLPPVFEPRPGVYNYAPCLVRAQDGRSLHAWYCANGTPGDVTDTLRHRKAVWKGGRWSWGAEDEALAPAASRRAWDSRHVCDPEVVAGRFRYRGRAWRYALLYLGCDAEASTHNQVGAAFANSLDGPWTRYPDPVIHYTDRADGGVVGEALGWPVYRYWGVGQPAAVSLDRAGRLAVLFSRGEEEHGAEMAVLDLSDMDRGPVLTGRRKMPAAGLGRPASGAPPGIVNVGVALDEARGRAYLVREELPPGDARFPDFIGASCQVAWMPWDDLRAGRGTWRIVADVDADRTGWPRNHNPALLRDAWGRITPQDRLTVGVSVAETYETAPPGFAWLWTYRITLLEVPVGTAARRR